MRPESIKKIAFINFGGIGDEILFAPVITEVKKHLPDTQFTLFLEDRSGAVKDLMPHVDEAVELDLQGQPRWKSFSQLWRLLSRKNFDVVISSGSNPMIPVLLLASGIPVRVGFETGVLSRTLLTVAAPLAPLRKGYAADMYFSLARGFLSWLLRERYQPTTPVLPQLKEPGPDDAQWAGQVLQGGEPARKILVHPGVSLVSVRKNILKSWPPVHWAELIRELAREGHQVYLVGGPDDRDSITAIRQALPPDLPGFTDLYGQTRNLRQLAALIRASDMLVCVDSSPVHLAVGYGKPVVVMFGPTDEKKLLPADPRFKAVALPDLSCRPCLWDIRKESCERPVCLDVPVPSMRLAVSAILDSLSA